jgi:hypothetical protein
LLCVRRWRRQRRDPPRHLGHWPREDVLRRLSRQRSRQQLVVPRHRYAAPPRCTPRRSPESPTPVGHGRASAYAPVCPQLDRATGTPEGGGTALLEYLHAKSALTGRRVPVMVFVQWRQRHRVCA